MKSNQYLKKKTKTTNRSMKAKKSSVSAQQPASHEPTHAPTQPPTHTMSAFSGNVTSSLNGNQTSSSNCPGAECYACGKAIKERYLLKALDKLWHEDCLKCSCCDCRLGEVGSTLYTKTNLILCKRDYLRLFGAAGLCSACNKTIPAFEMVMRAKGNVYHLDCFACQQCNHRFCVSDRFYLYENKILCEYDYEKRMAFAQLPQTKAAMDHVKRQTANAH